MKLYAVHDKKSEALSSYHVAKSDAVASRDFAAAVIEPRSVLGKYSEDFELVRLAELNDEVGDQTKEGTQLVMGYDHGFDVVLTARQVVDLQPKPGATSDPAQLALLREA